jgi:hypothetical protein
MITDLDISKEPSEPIARNLIFHIPSADLDIFGRLNGRCRTLVRRRLKAMRAIHRARKAKSARAACAEIANMFHGERGWSLETLQRLWHDYSETGDWKVLVDSAIAGPAWQNDLAAATLPAALLDHLAGQWAMHQRDKFASVYDPLIMRLNRWRAGDRTAAIPGYTEPPQDDPLTCVPPGWTRDNLRRAVKPRLSKFARKLVQIGPKYASQFGPKLLATRVGTEVGQWYIPDDCWADFKVLAYGQTCRLLSFHFLDLASGCNIARGFKPALRDEREVEERLREKEMVWLLVKLLTTNGYHPAGCTIGCEKSTSTIREREEQILRDCLGEDAIKIDRGPRGGGPGVAALFTGPGGGNPRWKAPIESWFNLWHNRTDHMIEFPGQTGSNSRLNLPEGLAGMERDTLALVKAARALPPEKAEKLRLGLLTHHEAILKLEPIIELINNRIDHQLEGWRECGHYVTEWRQNRQACWQQDTELLAYDAQEREAIAAVLAHDSALKRERALSPREVWDAGKDRLVKLPLVVAALLMDEMPGTEHAVQQGCITIESSEVSPGLPLTFGPMRRDGRGVAEPLRGTDKYMVRLNPLDPRVVWLYTADNKFAGIAEYYDRVHRSDTHALHARLGEKRKALAPLVDQARRLAAPLTRAATEAAEHNLAHVFGPRPGAGDPRGTKPADPRLANYAGDIADLADPPSVAAPRQSAADAPDSDPFSAEGLL